jgi:hypothetical protein
MFSAGSTRYRPGTDQYKQETGLQVPGIKFALFTKKNTFNQHKSLKNYGS